MPNLIKDGSSLWSSNIVQDSTGRQWCIAFNDAAGGDVPYAYYRDGDGSGWTEATQLDDVGADTQVPPRLIVTDLDEFIVIDAFRMWVYELATASTWDPTPVAAETSSASGSRYNSAGCAYQVDADNVDIHYIAGRATDGQVVTGIRRYNRSGGTLTLVAGSVQSLNSGSGGGCDATFEHDGSDYSTTRPTRVLLTWANLSGSVFSHLATRTAESWSYSGAQLVGIVRTTHVGKTTEARVTHLSHNPRLGKTLLVSGGVDSANQRVGVWEYTWATGAWGSLAHPLQSTNDVDEFVRDETIGGAYDGDDDVHVAYVKLSGSDEELIHDTWTRSTATWASEVEAVLIDSPTNTTVNHDSARVAAHRRTYQITVITDEQVFSDDFKFNRVPDPPPPVAPPDGAWRDLTADVAFTARYEDDDAGDELSAWAWRVSDDAGSTWQYWNAAGSALSGTEVWNPSSGVTPGDSFGFTLPGGSFANGAELLWAFNARDRAVDESGYAASAALTGGNPPTVTVDEPTAPVATTQPGVEWTYASLDAEAQATYRVRFYDAATYDAAGFDPADDDGSAAAWASGEVASAGTGPVAPAAHLIHGTTYKAYVLVTDARGAPSEWTAGAAFTVTLAGPDQPTLTATADHANSRVLLEAAAPHDTGDWGDGTARFERLVDGQWVTVLGGADVDYTAGAAAVWDEEAVNGVQGSWRVTTVGDNGEGSTVPSDPSTTATAALAGPSDWLKDFTDHSADLAVDVVALDPVDPGVDALFNPIGRPDTVVVSDVARWEAASVTFQTEDHDTRDALLALMASQRTLLLSLAPDYQGAAGDQWWIRFHGDRPRVRLHPTRTEFRRITQSWVRQPRPEND